MIEFVSAWLVIGAISVLIMMRMGKKLNERVTNLDAIICFFFWPLVLILPVIGWIGLVCKWLNKRDFWSKEFMK